MTQRQSAIRITPTPRAISPQDIVRIYVPAAPPEESSNNKYNSIGDEHRSPSAAHRRPNSVDQATASATFSPVLNARMANGGLKLSVGNGAHTSTVVDVLSNNENNEQWQSNRNSITYGSGDITPVRQCFDDEHGRNFGEAASITNQTIGNISNSEQPSTSSSRRGSLSQKSPSSQYDITSQWECKHISQRRLSSNSNNGKRYGNLSTSSEEVSTPTTVIISNTAAIVDDRQPIMTSFEQLASQQRAESAGYRREQQLLLSHNTSRSYSDHDGIDKLSVEDDENYSYAYYSLEKSPNIITAEQTRTKYVSDSNIQDRKAITSSLLYENNDGVQKVKRRPISSGNETNIFESDSISRLDANNAQQQDDQQFISTITTTSVSVHRPPKSTKTPKEKEYKRNYKRFYGTSVDDDDDDNGEGNEADDEEPKKSSDNDSSSSHNSKSNPSTPINEALPLLTSPIMVQPSGSASATQFRQNERYAESSQQHQSPPQHKQQFRSTPAINQTVMQHSSHIPASVTQPSFSNDLNRVLPPIETTRHMRILSSSPSKENHYVINAHPKYMLQKNGSNGNSSSSDPSTIRIEVIQNQRD